MLTQDPTLRAVALLKGATKPVTIFVGYYAHKADLLAAVNDRHLLKKSLPNTSFTVEPDMAPDLLAQALQDQWRRIHGEQARAQASPTQTPGRRHVWRQRDIARASR